jgi:pimeloyl-ACP methyl ester carboxylesterase
MVRSAEELRDRRVRDLETIRANGTAYHHVSGNELNPQYRLWLEAALPEVTITVLPGSGHFPHLARPAEFAAILAG